MIRSPVAKPTICRSNKSFTAAKYSHPSSVPGKPCQFVWLPSIIIGFIICQRPANPHERRHNKRPQTKVDGLFNDVGVLTAFSKKVRNTNGLRSVAKQYLLNLR